MVQGVKNTEDKIIINPDVLLAGEKRATKVLIGVGAILLFMAGIGIIPIIAGAVRHHIIKNKPQDVERKFIEKYRKKATRKGKELVIVYNPEGEQFYDRKGTQLE